MQLRACPRKGADDERQNQQTVQSRACRRKGADDKPRNRRTVQLRAYRRKGADEGALLGYFFLTLKQKCRKDLDTPGNARTIVTMDYIHGEFFFPQQRGQSFAKEYSLTLLTKAEL